jgi:hypothetical protein
MTTLEVRERTSVPCAGFTLTFGGDGSVTLSAHGGDDRTIHVPDLGLSNFVELWCAPDAAFFVGQKGRGLWHVDPVRARARQVATLNRLDLAGRYDPGGLHRVKFDELDDGDLLIVHELGVLRVARGGSCRWQQSHDQLGARVERIADGVVWFKGEYESFGFDLVDGRPVIAPGA